MSWGPVDFTFIVELLTQPDEKGLLSELRQNPKDRACRGAYVDYLLEAGREMSAEAVRRGYTPGAPPPLPEASAVPYGGFVAGTLVSGTINSGAITGWRTEALYAARYVPPPPSQGPGGGQ